MVLIELIRRLRAFGRPRLLLIAGAALALALIIALTVPRASEMEPPRPVQHQRITCERAAELIEEAQSAGRPGPLVHIEAQRAVIWADPGQRPSLETPYHLRCDRTELTAVGAIYPGGDRMDYSPSAFLAQPMPSGRLQIERLCLGCDDFGPPSDPRELMRALHILGAALGILGLWVLLALWVMRRPRIAPLLGEAPSEAEAMAPEPLSGARLVPVRGGEPLRLAEGTWTVKGGELRPATGGGEETPRLELPSSGPAFRGVSASPPRVFGPARVNGLPVPKGASTPVQPGDVIALGGRAFWLRSDNTPSPLMRYHLPGPNLLSHLRIHTEHAPAPLVMYLTMILSALLACSIQWPGVAGWIGAAGLLVCTLISGAASPSLPSYEWVTIDITSPGKRLTPLGAVEVRGGKNGAFELDAIAAGDGHLVIEERVPPCPRRNRAAEMALRQALIAEGRLLEERLLAEAERP